MPRTAKEKFVTGPHKAEWEKIAQTAAFEEACHAAVAVFLEEQPEHFGAPDSSWQAGVRIAGARRVLAILSELHKPNEVPKRVPERTPYQK